MIGAVGFFIFFLSLPQLTVVMTWDVLGEEDNCKQMDI